MSKADLRREMRVRLRAITAVERAQKSAVICAAIARHSAYLQARSVVVFDPMPGEPDIGMLWERAPRRFIYPRIDGEELLLIEVPDRAGLIARDPSAKFREPAHVEARLVNPRAVDLILVPGLAFTKDGRRLGRGGGYYDRLLARLPATTPKLGICFDVQIVDDLPAEAHDMRVDAVIS